MRHPVTLKTMPIPANNIVISIPLMAIIMCPHDRDVQNIAGICTEYVDEFVRLNCSSHAIVLTKYNYVTVSA